MSPKIPYLKDRNYLELKMRVIAIMMMEEREIVTYVRAKEERSEKGFLPVS